MSFLALYEIFLFVYSNARSILKLMLCNQNITKLDILTLFCSDCRAWAQKLSEQLKKQKKCFCPHFANSNFRIVFLHFLFKLFFNISYPKSSLNLCDEYRFCISKNVIKVVKIYIFQKSLTSHETKWTLLFLSFSLAWPKTKAKSLKSQQ